MFRAAVKEAMGFTLPMVTSLLTCSGVCRSGIGTFVIVNDEGWFVTAAHMMKSLGDLADAEAKTRAKEQAVIQGSRASRRASKNMAPSPNDIDKWSAWFGLPGVGLDQTAGSQVMVEPCDLAVGKLTNFDPSTIKNYPVFKDPNKDFDPGTSLCRLGFPFYDVGTSYAAGSGFQLANVPLPIFPNEGILSRSSEIRLIDPTGKPLPPPFPLLTIETSSPGIRGQSGGPIFDQHGAIWGIQSATRSYPLEFGTKIEQYYHVGVGVSSATIVGLLQHLNVKFAMSAH
jgi:Trypsin-like peptidase domain